MPKVMLTCRVCGKRYEACHSARHNIDGVFRYQEVACSPECGAIYLNRVNESRGIPPVNSGPAHVEQETVDDQPKHKRKAVKAKKSDDE